MLVPRFPPSDLLQRASRIPNIPSRHPQCVDSSISCTHAVTAERSAKRKLQKAKTANANISIMRRG